MDDACVDPVPVLWLYRDPALIWIVVYVQAAFPCALQITFFYFRLEQRIK